MIKKIFKKISIRNRGFTIIETLVAITILMISIAGPLTIAQKGLTASLYAKDQVTASFLAQDAMEFIKNEKIKNLSNFVSWISGFGNCDNGAHRCSVNTLDAGSISNTRCGLDCYLYIQPNGTYGTTVTSNISKFERGFYMYPDLTENGVTVTVVVTWYNGTIPNSVSLQNNLFDVEL